MNKVLVKTTDLKPGMICVDMGYTDIILTVVYDSGHHVHLKFLRPDGTVRGCSYPIYSKVTIYQHGS